MSWTLVRDTALADSALDQVRLEVWETEGGRVLTSTAPVTSVVAESAASSAAGVAAPRGS